MHRDIKGANLLLNNKGVLKLTDFGLARKFDPKIHKMLTNRVVTLWYRAPELILGSMHYDFKIDTWSVGCFLLELFMGKPLFPGKNELTQIDLIFQMLGTPTEDEWPGVSKLKLYGEMSQKKYTNRLSSHVKSKMKNVDDETLSFLSGLLSLDP